MGCYQREHSWHQSLMCFVFSSPPPRPRLGLCVFAEPPVFLRDAFSLQTDISQRNCYRCKLFTVIHLTVVSHVFFVFALFLTIICFILCILCLHIFMMQGREMNSSISDLTDSSIPRFVFMPNSPYCDSNSI